MRITSAKFIKSLVDGYGEFNMILPEVALVGRSNVGKSSLINFLTNQTKLAKVSKNPGKTKLVNYFLLNNGFYLVDLPGYGFANVSKQEQQQWNMRIQNYFEQSRMLKGLIILFDIRRELTNNDYDMIEYANYFHIPYIILATKADKLAKSKRKNACLRIRKKILSYEGEILPVSSEANIGRDEVLDLIEKFCFEKKEVEK